MSEWFEEFFNGLYQDVLPKQFDPGRSVEQARTVKRLLKVRKGQCVCDLACGHGRLTIPLAQMGLEMTGLDLTAAFLKKARRFARQNGVDIRFIHRDMRDIDFQSQFDAVFNWFTSFGYFNDRENLDVCKRVYGALKPGGRFLIESLNQSWLLVHWRPTLKQTLGEVAITTCNRWNARRGTAVSTWTFQKGDVTESHRITVRIYNGAEMRRLLRQAGFRDIQLYTHRPIGRFTRHSKWLIAIGRRPR